MTLLLFVYSRTSFQVVGRNPVRRFDPEKRIPWPSMIDAIHAGASGELEPGIYGVISDDPSAKEIDATGAVDRSLVAYDIVPLDDKDPWLKRVETDAQLLKRVRTLIPQERDSLLTDFMIARGA